MVEEIHAKLKSDETSGVGWNSSTHDRHKSFVERHWTFILHQSLEDVANTVGVGALWGCLETTLENVLWHSDGPVGDTGCWKNKFRYREC
jgi:hypothetical protein